ncbi:MAG: Gfo/Idh/MocA family oxidoreductase [Candidatus Poribacteria bacterium]|nr:Gfo/Idh/MocA family oxidoreductase [Candidatus Poribacteria bacterium]
MTTYRAGVIGLGRMGSTFDDEITQGGSIFLPYCHGPSYHAAPNVELVAGADPHEEQAAIFGERWGLSTDHLYSDYREMLEKERLDLVSVCTTARIRSGIVQDAARAGVKAIWAEKPIALTLEEADAMVRVCQEQGAALAVNCARRWNPFFSEARQMIEAGELGDILQVTVYAQCGLSHNGSHAIDVLRYLAGGNVEWVFGEMESDEAAAGEDDLMGNGYLAFDNGVRGYLRSMPCGVASWEVDVIGEKGRIRSLANALEFELIRMAPGGPRDRGVPAKVPFPWPVRMQGMGLSIVENLIQAIETGAPPKCSGEDGRAALEIAVGLRESHRRGGVKVNLPLADRSLGIRSSEIRQDEVPARIRRLQQASS